MARPGSSGNKPDPFALLFDPPSPTGKSKPIFTTTFKPDVLATSGHGHSKTNSQSSITSNPLSAISSDSEFGSFVSVTAFEHPLQSPISPTRKSQPPSSSNVKALPHDIRQSENFFSQFTGEAKERAQATGKKVLDELLAHDNDPFHPVGAFDTFQESGLSASETSTPALEGESLIDFTDGDYFSGPFSSDLSGEDEQSGPLQTRTPRSTPLASSPTSTSFTPTRSQSPRPAQPTNTSPRPSSPVPIPSPSSPPRSPSLSRSWMSTLRLNRSSRPSVARASTSESSAEETHTILSQPDHTHSWFWDKPIADSRKTPLHSPIPGSLSSSRSPPRTPILGSDHSSISRPASATNGQPHGRSTLLGSVGSTLTAAALPPTTSSTITHGTPFASHPFLPLSGAPGFTGDRNWNERGFDFDKKMAEKQESQVELKGRKDFTEPVLGARIAGQVRPHLPALSRLPSSWRLLYSLDQDGISLNTLYTNCADYEGGVLIAMQDSMGVLFGVWLGDGLRMSKGAYYGSGDSFLWTTYHQGKDNVRVYRWTGKNDYVALCESSFLSFGGGDGYYGLYLESSLIDGTTHPCPTFGNECLTGGERVGQLASFECVGLEVWGVGN